jgi:MscS family membrane protein
MNGLVQWAERLDGWSFAGNTLRTWLVCLLVVALGLLVSRLIRRGGGRVMARLTHFTRTEFDDRLAAQVVGPLSAVALLPFLHACATILDLPGRLSDTLTSAIWVAAVIAVAVAAIRAADVFFSDWLVPWADRQEPRVDPGVVELGRKVVKVLLIVLTFLGVLERAGFDVISVLAGLGIGGLAVALAAQETLGNMLGSVQLLTDRPFAVGDFVQFDGALGRVQEVGLRSTRVVTATGIRVVIPNRLLASQAIRNYSAMHGITVEQTLGLVYDTPPEAIERAVTMVREVLAAHRDVSPVHRVWFEALTESALNLRMVYFVTNFERFVDVKHEVNLAVLRCFNQAGLRLAFPTRTVHIVERPQSASTDQGEP